MDKFFLDNCPGLLVRTDLAGVILDSNREAHRALGATSIQGKSLQELVHSDDQAAFAAHWAEISAGGGAVRAVSSFQGTDSIQRFAWTAQRVADRDEVHAMLVPLPDEKQPSPKRIDDPAMLLRALLDHCEISVSAVDLDGRFVFQDGKGLAAAGFRPGQFLGQSIFDLYKAQSADIRKTMTDGEPAYQKIDLHDVLWETSRFALRDDHGKIIGVGFGTINKSDVKRTMQELQTKLQQIERQQEVIRNLETPIIQVWNRVLTLPMVGIVDSQRAERVMNDLLAMVSSKGAHYAILDLTGVDTVDTATALHLFNMIDAIRLLGAEGIISGIRPSVAQTMVTLGLDLSKITTCGNLQSALRLCIQRMTAANKMANAM